MSTADGRTIVTATRNAIADTARLTTSRRIKAVRDRLNGKVLFHRQQDNKCAEDNQWRVKRRGHLAHDTSCPRCDTFRSSEPPQELPAPAVQP